MTERLAIRPINSCAWALRMLLIAVNEHFSATPYCSKLWWEVFRMRSVFSVSLPEKIARELEAYARETGRNKSDIVRESISL
ncbi:TPA: ribbon-helix-helix protein, CopG family, partial [Candidatus Poribacteria bacterium]|nr:ribbon-helix-helix protein, CopG family [Candidatus Poribacteria bacterium]HEX28556.1 ribbon-helix-helix protein, CopG family [Candidatus Poribacteria bacterium]